MIRINKLLAAKGIASRRDIDFMITQGRVKVNGKKLEAPGVSIDPAVDKVEVDGLPVNLAGEEHTYLLLNKPVGYLCSRQSQGGAPIVFDLPSLKGFGNNLKYAGRLDRETSGLLVMTTDGDFANRITHPSFEQIKKYHVFTRSRLTAESLSALKSGFAGLEDGTLDYLEVKEMPTSRKLFQYDVWVAEGRNRMVRRIFSAVGHPVEKLERYAIGDLLLSDLAPGSVRELQTNEIIFNKSDLV